MNVGMMRVKNEARWIKRCVESILPICERVLIMDDHSTDGTADICASIPGVKLLASPFDGLNETRDKNWLLSQVGPADWIVAIDGDELLADPELLLKAMEQPVKCLRLPILYLWNSEDQVRVDGVYRMYKSEGRASVFRPNGAVFQSTQHGGNFHCGNVPAALRPDASYCRARLLHFGYMHREDRERKFSWYNQQDPGNNLEDHYRHMVVGDIFPAESRFEHGGPLRLEPV